MTRNCACVVGWRAHNSPGVRGTGAARAKQQEMACPGLNSHQGGGLVRRAGLVGRRAKVIAAVRCQHSSQCCSPVTALPAFSVGSHIGNVSSDTLSSSGHIEATFCCYTINSAPCSVAHLRFEGSLAAEAADRFSTLRFCMLRTEYLPLNVLSSRLLRASVKAAHPACPP